MNAVLFDGSLISRQKIGVVLSRAMSPNMLVTSMTSLSSLMVIFFLALEVLEAEAFLVMGGDCLGYFLFGVLVDMISSSWLAFSQFPCHAYCHYCYLHWLLDCFCQKSPLPLLVFELTEMVSCDQQIGIHNQQMTHLVHRQDFALH